MDLRRVPSGDTLEHPPECLRVARRFANRLLHCLRFLQVGDAQVSRRLQIGLRSCLAKIGLSRLPGTNDEVVEEPCGCPVVERDKARITSVHPYGSFCFPFANRLTGGSAQRCAVCPVQVEERYSAELRL